MKKFSFSGHETFACKIYWLKKGYDFILSGKKFTDEDAVVELGVGKNMVTSIRFWLKAFGIVDDNDETTQLADYLFGDQGVDLYLEDPLSLWLLHYQLIKQEKASIYSLVFNFFRRERAEFTREQLKKFLKRKIEENKGTFSEKTLDSDIKAFLNNYLSGNSNEVEEGFINILQELGLITSLKRHDDNDHLVEWYRFDTSPKQDLPIEALLYVILDNTDYGSSISLSSLANDPTSLGNVFLLTETTLAQRLQQIPSAYGVYTETAGNPVLQVNEGLDSIQLLRNYYEIENAGL
ncbi:MULTISPECIES: DUF4007 family protein [Sphingobacterium]|uniref:DUF4007 family protein n=1 Tax=Sphingobacterium TaxID=28453 RepID=UPI001048CFCF|nr:MULTISPECIES: DUF4007 family protein [Sphingobacterium]MCW2260118.1 hypothetical protein [Sphingobacterium kitahiroshimense]TCR11091.1 uncharacterized protein DUF4007 [Sphingobacterium sp. JUb78]